MSLDPDHPLRPIITRLSIWFDPDPNADPAVQQAFDRLVSELLNNDLFNRLPHILKTAVLAYGGNLHPSVDRYLVDIADAVAEGATNTERLEFGVRLRIEYYHEGKTDGTVVPLDPPR